MKAKRSNRRRLSVSIARLFATLYHAIHVLKFHVIPSMRVVQSLSELTPQGPTTRQV